LSVLKNSRFELASVPEVSSDVVLMVLPDESEDDLATEILCCLVESPNDPVVFFQPTDVSFNDVAAFVCLSIEVNSSSCAVLVRFLKDASI
jgi:hypothetical protein